MNPVEIIIKAKDEASSVFSSMGAKLAAVGASIAAYFGISAFVGAIKGAGDLEAKLSEVKAVSGATAEEMVALRQAAEAAGASTKFTATEAADALGNLSRAGISAKDAMAALPAVLQLAQAGGIGLAEASEYVSKTVMGMGLSFADAGRVADVLAMGANASNTSVTGLAQALSYSAPLAKSLGVSLESTVAIIGKFADAGIDASRAGTALNAVMAQFADPTSKFSTELAGAGITTTNFEQALRQLAAAGPAGAKAILAVGTEAGPALRALLNQGIGALDELKGKLDNAAGSAAKTAAIMENNFNGSLKSLSSAWDTVKNALATPVLPVLEAGVTSLSKAFATAVDSGLIGRFGTAIATAFEGGIKWAKGFAASVDFTALATRMQVFASQAQDSFTKIGQAATNAGNVVKTTYGVMAAGSNAVMTAVYGLGVAISGVVAGALRALASLYDGMAKITFGSISEKYRQMAADVRQSAEATNAVSRAMADKTIKSFIDMGDAAQLARNGWAGLNDEATAASNQAAIAGPVFDGAAKSLGAMGAAAAEAGDKTKQGADKQKAASAAATQAVADLRAEYEAALNTGNWQLAAEKMQAMAVAAKEAGAGTADLKKQAEEAALATAASFERMGIKTKAELATIAEVAKQDFERIKSSGMAATTDIQTAFKKYATDAIAANGGVVTEALKVQAAMAKVTIETDGTGKAIVKSMSEGAASIQTVADAFRQLGIKSPEELNKIAEANRAAWDKIKGDTSIGAESLKTAFKAYADSAIAASGNVGSGQRIVTEAMLSTEAAAKGLTIAFDESGKIIVKTQKEAQDELNKTKNAVDGVTGALEKQNSELERSIAAQEKAVQLAERKKALEDKANRVDADGFQIDNAGNRLTVNTQTDRSVYENAKSQGLSEAQALQISNQFIQNGQMVGGSGANSYAGETWYTELQKAIDKIVLDNARAAAKGSASTTGSAAGSTSSSATQNHTYTVNIPNYGTVNVASASDASSLTNIIDQLARAKATAGV